MRKKQCVAMLLAGGQGSRLGILTKDVAKPAVPYGGKYRIIDFPLSNCTNSGIDVVGVLTQYRPLELNAYIGSGSPWDLDLSNGGVYVLPPYQTGKTGEWYKGTANAIYQNIDFIDSNNPEYVLILSGDHIYKMDYSKMLAFHKAHNAAATIAVMEVPMEEANRFGIMNTEDGDKIYEFEEKPESPKSNLASMGIYIFTWDRLRDALIEDNSIHPDSDFGKHIIPKMLDEGQPMYAWRFDGYWKDVGTIDSLWEANMDLLDPKVPMDLYDPSWKIYSRNPCMPPHYIAPGAKVQNSMVSEGCEIAGHVDFSILFSGVHVAKNAVVDSSILMPGAVVEEGAEVHFAIVAENAVIRRGAYVGERPELMADKDQWGVTVIGAGVTVGAGAIVPARGMVEEDVGEVL